MAAVGRRAVLAALLANVGVAVTKLIGFLLTGSSSLLAEVFHSVADSGNQALLLVGSKRASETPSPAHPFGRGRERYFWAFIVGLVLFGLGGVFSIFEGIRKLLAGTHELSAPLVAIALLGVAALIEGLSLRTAIKEANRIRPAQQGWTSFLRRTRNAEVTVVMLEDGAAMVGLLLAFRRYHRLVGHRESGVGWHRQSGDRGRLVFGRNIPYRRDEELADRRDGADDGGRWRSSAS